MEVGWLGNYVRSAYGCVMEGGCWWRRSGQREHEMGKRLLCRRDGRWGGATNATTTAEFEARSSCLQPEPREEGEAMTSEESLGK